MRAILLLLPVLAASGCADECTTAESQCADGRTIEHCLQTDGFLGNHWGDSDQCPGGTGCVDVIDPRDGDRAAVCASSREPDPRCPEGMDGGDGYFDSCADPETQLRCHFGYAREIPCDHGCRVSTDLVHGYCAP